MAVVLDAIPKQPLCAGNGRSELQCEVRIAETQRSLGADAELVGKRGLPTYEDANELVVVAVDRDGKEHRLEPTAAASYLLMERAAREDGVSIYAVSTYRGFARQEHVYRRELQSGRSLESTFSSIAPP